MPTIHELRSKGKIVNNLEQSKKIYELDGKLYIASYETFAGFPSLGGWKINPYADNLSKNSHEKNTI